MNARLAFTYSIAILISFCGCANQLRKPSSDETSNRYLYNDSALNFEKKWILGNKITPDKSETLSPADHKIYIQLLEDSLELFNTNLRNDLSGQYLDALDLNTIDYLRNNSTSSTASTGMGLIALVVSDKLGLETNAIGKVLITLRNLTKDESDNSSFKNLRSENGWYRHWFNVENGNNDSFSIQDGYSTIDTAILAAGAQFAANYFSHTDASSKESTEIRKLADQILTSVNWSSAISNLKRGKLVLNYDLASEKPKKNTYVFNEYALVACMGKVADLKLKQRSQISNFWDLHYRDPKDLPIKKYNKHPLLTDGYFNYLSSFAIQFTMYLCGDISNHASYLNYFANAQKADRDWFSKETTLPYMWGLGAGETIYFDKKTNNYKSVYHADAINKNPYYMVSPHIIAGFLPVYPKGINDLLKMKEENRCIYTYDNKLLLWRCSLMSSQPVNRLQSIDFSSMFLGLSSYHPEIGLEFFQRYSPRTY